MVLHQEYDDSSKIKEQFDITSIPNIYPGAKLSNFDKDWKLVSDVFAASMIISNAGGSDKLFNLVDVSNNLQKFICTLWLLAKFKLQGLLN